MNIKYFNKLILTATVILTLSLVACVDDLDTTPIDEKLSTKEKVLVNEDAYQQLLAKCYAAYMVGGQKGVDDEQDISSINGGFSSYLRLLWNLQELPTDEAICAWNDGNLRDIHDQDWNADNEFVKALYYRANLEITYCNNIIKQAGDNADYAQYKTEARVLRALSYWHLLDFFRTGPFVTEKDQIGTFFFPEQATAKELFDYVETELTTIESELVEPQTNEYGRVDKAVAWMILAKLYLNAEVYIGENKYTECITYCNKIINAGYKLEPDYQSLFLADNHLRTDEIIFPIASDGDFIQTWGGMTFILHSSVGGDMPADESGIDGGWGGNRTTKAFVNYFNDITGKTDKRATFFTQGQSLEISDIFDFQQGYALRKFKNVTSNDEPGKSLSFPDTDFPMFRYADVLLMYAEATLRGGAGGSKAVALSYINDIRERAYGNTSGNITVSELTLDFILAERAREMYWECHRRTDLVRFGKLTGGSYVWPWKGAVAGGIATDDKYDIYPIPASDINANPNLKQIEDY